MKKQRILKEIQRTAKANGGVPLGIGRFLKKTGIKVSDWRGVHWIRWNDAVREAGFTPNRKNEAYESEWLLQQLIALIRELGHFPISAELRIQARHDSKFPDEQTLYGRFGPKSQMVSRVIKYCGEHEGFDDILALFGVVAGSESPAPHDVSMGDGQMGFVYLLKSGRFYKMGTSNASGRREYELEIQLAGKVSIVHQISTDDPVGIEAYWHKRFESQRKNDRWFELRAPDVEAFTRRNSM